MVLGRLTHIAFDLLAVSTVIAAVKKTTGFEPATNLIPDSSIRSIADGYFSAGETIFHITAGQAVSSSWFKRS